ncbi:hypothetical protein [Actinomadura sp. CNU-125]|uniref:hypothetical protein n=1 Tax=Actinomadura sp. CNU-125 TaxID=1904961 RepID=UPI00096AAF5D|nr:hypothetical protein [Actinomadura sp. CNU-125]
MNDDRGSGRPNRRTAELLLSGSAPAGRHAALRALLDAAPRPRPDAPPARPGRTPPRRVRPPRRLPHLSGRSPPPPVHDGPSCGGSSRSRPWS